MKKVLLQATVLPPKIHNWTLVSNSLFQNPEIGEFTQFNQIGLDVDDYHKAVYLGIFTFGFSST